MRELPREGGGGMAARNLEGGTPVPRNASQVTRGLGQSAHAQQHRAKGRTQLAEK